MTYYAIYNKQTDEIDDLRGKGDIDDLMVFKDRQEAEIALGEYDNPDDWYVDTVDEDKLRSNEESEVLRIRMSGNTSIIYVQKMISKMGLTVGDEVRVILKRLD